MELVEAWLREVEDRVRELEGGIKSFNMND